MSRWAKRQLAPPPAANPHYRMGLLTGGVLIAVESLRDAAKCLAGPAYRDVQHSIKVVDQIMAEVKAGEEWAQL